MGGRRYLRKLLAVVLVVCSPCASSALSLSEHEQAIRAAKMQEFAAEAQQKVEAGNHSGQNALDATPRVKVAQSAGEEQVLDADVFVDGDGDEVEQGAATPPMREEHDYFDSLDLDKGTCRYHPCGAAVLL